MAIDTYVNVTLSLATQPNRNDLIHAVKMGTANANDVTIAFDKTKVASVHVLQSVFDQAIVLLQGGNALTL